MKLTFLGVGDAFSENLKNNSAYIEFGNTNLFIDFPATNRASLKKIGKELSFVENVYITHLHEDHINGIQQLAYYHEIVTKKKPNLYIHENILNEFWDTVKSGLSKTTKGIRTLSDYFNVNTIKDNKFNIGEQEFETVLTNHVPGMFSYGILVKPFFYYSGDANVDFSTLSLVNNEVEKIFHDCHLWDLKIESHASLEDIKNLPVDIKQKMILMHYHDGYSNNSFRLPFEKREKLELARELKTYFFGG